MIIYKCVNTLNGKRYIGKTIFNLEHRKYKHIQSSRLGSNNHFHRALSSNGLGVFKWSVIHGNILCKDKLNELEIYYIDKLKPEYNMTKGGEGTSGYKITEDHRRKLSLSHKGNKHTKETREKMSKTWKEKYKDPKTSEARSKQLKGKNLGKKLSSEAKEKISNSLKGNIPWNKGKKMTNDYKERVAKKRGWK